MKTFTKYLIAIGLVTITYGIPYFVHPLILGLGESDDIGLGWGYIWLSVLIMSITLSIVSLLTNRYNSIFSIYSCLLGLSFIYFLIDNPTSLYQIIIPPILFGLVLLYLNIKEIKKSKGAELP